MTDTQQIWTRSRDDLVCTVAALGFPEELGDLIARQLGSPKAMDRMTAYLRYTAPTDERIIVDEMLAIRAEIDAWREKKESREAGVVCNELLWYGLEDAEG